MLRGTHGRPPVLAKAALCAARWDSTHIRFHPQWKTVPVFKGTVGGWGVTCLRAHSRREDKPGWAGFSDQFWNHTQTLSPALHRPRHRGPLTQRGQPPAPRRAHSGSRPPAAAPACILLASVPGPVLGAMGSHDGRGPSQRAVSGRTHRNRQLRCSRPRAGTGTTGETGRGKRASPGPSLPRASGPGRRGGEPGRARLSGEAISEVIPSGTT